MRELVNAIAREMRDRRVRNTGCSSFHAREATPDCCKVNGARCASPRTGLVSVTKRGRPTPGATVHQPQVAGAPAATIAHQAFANVINAGVFAEHPNELRNVQPWHAPAWRTQTVELETAGEFGEGLLR